MTFDLEQYLKDHREFSVRAFGCGQRTEGCMNHIQQYADDIKESPSDFSNYANLILLAFDAAMRAGFKPAEIIRGIEHAHDMYKVRRWPPVGSIPDNQPIEHIKCR